MIKDMEEHMVNIKHNLKETHDRKKIYAYKGRVANKFQMGERVFMKVKPKKISLKLGGCTKFRDRFCGSF
jgi:hypothetical protein